MKNLYILVSADRASFKIGIGDNPALRWKQLRADFCVTDSFYLTVSKGALKVEQMLHILFSDFNRPQSGDGGTEWFDAKCLPEVEAFLQHNTSRLGLGEKQRPDLTPVKRRVNKSTPLPIRYPNEMLEKVEDDAKALRRSKASIIVEIIERHYENGGRHLGVPPLATRKKAGAR
jgi:hypothetical protein